MQERDDRHVDVEVSSITIVKRAGTRKAGHLLRQSSNLVDCVTAGVLIAQLAFLLGLLFHGWHLFPAARFRQAATGALYEQPLLAGQSWCAGHLPLPQPPHLHSSYS